MRLESLSIVNFKNIADASLRFSPSINCLLGNNGMGKSNLLDAIYFLSFCRSYSGMTDSAVMKRDADFFMLQGRYLRKGVEEDLSIGMNRGKRKVLKRKGKEYDRLSRHIGTFPLVMVSPQDSFLITGSGEERRRLMDMIISQSDAVYLDSLIRYNRSLEQRNKLLRAHVVDAGLYEAVEVSLCASAEAISSARMKWLPLFSDLLRSYYTEIAGHDEDVSIRLKTHLAGDAPSMQRLLDEARRHDEIVGYTSVGPHRDDLEIMVNGLDARRAASQGQCKTITVAMRLAQFDFLCQATGVTPLLLLDDIFDKLDSSRVENIVKIVRSPRFGQIFITDTNRDHLDNILHGTGDDRAMWLVENGCFTPISSDHETH